MGRPATIAPDQRAAVAEALRRHAGPDGYVPIGTLRAVFPTDVLAAHLLPALVIVNAEAGRTM